MYEKSIQRGATSISAPQELKDDNGTVIVATIKTVIRNLLLFYLSFLVW
jgi:hypothetical protein